MNMSLIANAIAARNADAAARDAQSTIMAGQDRSLAALGQGYNTARGDITGANTSAINAINQGGTAAQGFFDQGLDRSLSALSDGVGGSWAGL